MAVQLSMAQANDEVWRLARQATEAAGVPLGGAAANGSREPVEPYDRLGTPSLPMGQLKALHVSSPVDNPLADVRSCPPNIKLISPLNEPTCPEMSYAPVYKWAAKPVSVSEKIRVSV